MIASRFSPMRHIGLAAGAALICYLVSQQVAAERATLAGVEREIVQAKRDIRQLTSELGARGRMDQLERWNGDLLALSAPRASQFVESEVRLAALHEAPLPVDPAIAASRGAVRLASAERPVAPPAARPVPAEPMLRQATYIKPNGEALAAVPTRVALLDADLLGDIGRAAASERGDGKPAGP